jgi:hypothetical protein
LKIRGYISTEQVGTILSFLLSGIYVVPKLGTNWNRQEHDRIE